MPKPVARETRPCGQCGKPITRRPKKSIARVYCNKRCESLAKRVRETRACAGCGKPVTRIPSEFKFANPYCSPRCFGLHSGAPAPAPLPDTLPASAFTPAEIRPWGAPQQPDWDRRVAWEQQRATDWLAARKPQAA